jgi:hypothetical protein
MNIENIKGYRKIIKEVMTEYKIKDNQRTKIDRLIRNYFQGDTVETHIRMLLESEDDLSAD